MIRSLFLFTKFVTLFMVVFLSLAGCKPVTETYVTQTPKAGEPTVQVIEITPLPTNTPEIFLEEVSPSATFSADAATPIVVAQPTAESTLTVDEALLGQKFPLALIRVENPGRDSKLASPIVVLANVFAGQEGLVSIQLIGEDGRLMADQLLKLTVPPSGWVYVSASVPFEITSAGESALIVVSTRDAYGRRISQLAVPVLLLQMGKSEIEIPGFNREPFVISSPGAGGSIKNGQVYIEGFAHPYNGNPLIMELITQTGGILASKVVPLKKIPLGQDYTLFSLDMQYSVEKRTSVRLTIRQVSTVPFGVDVALSSRVLYLEP
jgi:hypothetical protein